MKLIIQWPYQTVQETFLPLWISVDLIRGVARQLSQFVQVLIHKHIALFQRKKLPLSTSVPHQGYGVHGKHP
jgi:hypothetical protein